MLQNGRGTDSEFRFFHCLFYRCKADDVVNDRLLPLSIPYKNTSVNWSKYSKPWDVIFDHPNHGIAQLVICDLPKELPKERVAGQQPKLHSFVPQHVPITLNYSHSEIWTWKEGAHLPKANLSETVKKEFRQIMSDRAVILHAPN